MSAVTRTEVLRRAAETRPLEPGWAQDVTGQPTLDAKAALAGAIADDDPERIRALIREANRIRAILP